MLIIRKQQVETLDLDLRRRMAISALRETEVTTPHAVLGLSNEEQQSRLDKAVNKTVHYRLNNLNDIETFIQLSFLVGPNFDQYPRFKKILTLPSSITAQRTRDLLHLANEQDWHWAAQYDIVSRYQEAAVAETSTGTNQGDGIVLVPLSLQYTESYHALALHPDVWRMARIKPMLKVEQVQHFIQTLNQRGTTGYAVVDQNNQLVGATFAFIQSGATRVSYWIARGIWGHGVATKALMALIQILRRKHKKNLVLNIESANLPSIKVAKKCGFNRHTASIQSGWNYILSGDSYAG